MPGNIVLDFLIYSSAGDQKLAERERVLVSTSDFRVAMYSIEPQQKLSEIRVESKKI
jgi:hypothetical protein